MIELKLGILILTVLAVMVGVTWRVKTSSHALKFG